MKVTVNLNNDFFRNLSSGLSRRVSWIKQVREMTGMGLKQTKDILDAAFPITSEDNPFELPLSQLTTMIYIQDEDTLRAIRCGSSNHPNLKNFISFDEVQSKENSRQALIKAVTAGLKNGEFEAAKKIIQLLEVL